MSAKTALIVGASRNLGLGLATEYAHRGWDVIGTVRGSRRTALHDLAEASRGRVMVESLDMTKPEQVTALRERLARHTLDLLFVNAAITRGNIPIGDVPEEMFAEVMVTNALSPDARGRVLPLAGCADRDHRRHVLAPGQYRLEHQGGQDVYRASKSALNQLMRSYAARYADAAHTLLLICPGHVRTELGGPDAPLTIDQSVPGVVGTIDHHRGEPGLKFVNYEDQPVPW